jgi:hypothetical protein
MSNTPETAIDFNPAAGRLYPCTARVEVLLGGVGRLMFDDGTHQFAENETYPDIVYSPRLAPADLEAFCEQNMVAYENHHVDHRHAINDGDAPAITRFWEAL